MTQKTEMILNPSHSRAWLALIIGAAIILRVYAIDRLPPGLFGDEAVEGLDALDILAGNWQIWFHAHLGREPLYVYLTAISYALFGVSSLATRLPALVIGIATVPVAYWFAREWAANLFDAPRARRLALLTAALVAISFWHLQISRNAHRDILVPFVEAIGYALLWRALTGVIARSRATKQSPSRDAEVTLQTPRRFVRTIERWKLFALAGAVLGLAIYTYSPGRFVGIFIAIFFALEFLLSRAPRLRARISTVPFNPRGWFSAGAAAALVMLPLILYFAQNPAQFSRRFDSVSVLGAPAPLDALTASVSGNLAMFVVPDAGYQSKHYNLPGKPVFDLFIAPWFLAGFLIALARAARAEYRFLLLWFFVMMLPAFLTADMIPKGVRGFAVIPGVFVFVALAMDWVLERAANLPLLFRERVGVRVGFFFARTLVSISLVGSLLLTVNDYFFAWANLPVLPAAFDQDYSDVGAYVRRQPASTPIYVSAETYRHPTFMLLGKHIPTSRYLDRATRIREFNARNTMLFGAHDAIAHYVFVGDYAPRDEWLARVATPRAPLQEHAQFAVLRAQLAPPRQNADVAFNPYLRLIGYSRFDEEPRGIALYWRVDALPADRVEMDARVTLLDARSQMLAQAAQRFGVPPLEWNRGDVIVDWYEVKTGGAEKFLIEFDRGKEKWQTEIKIK